MSGDLFTFGLLVFNFFAGGQRGGTPRVRYNTLLGCVILNLGFLNDSCDASHLCGVRVTVFCPVVGLRGVYRRLQSTRRLPMPELERNIQVTRGFTSFHLIGRFIRKHNFVNGRNFHRFTGLFGVCKVIYFKVEAFFTPHGFVKGFIFGDPTGRALFPTTEQFGLPQRVMNMFGCTVVTGQRPGLGQTVRTRRVLTRGRHLRGPVRIRRGRLTRSTLHF